MKEIEVKADLSETEKTWNVARGTIYDRYLFSHRVFPSFYFDAAERLKALKKAHHLREGVLVPLRSTDTLNILQVLALRKAESLCEQGFRVVLLELNSRVLEVAGRSPIQAVVEELLGTSSGLEFSSDAAMKDRTAPGRQLVLKQAELEEENESQRKYLDELTQVALSAEILELGCVLLGQPEAYMFEFVLSLLENRNEQGGSILPIYLPSLTFPEGHYLKVGAEPGQVETFLIECLNQGSTLAEFGIHLLTFFGVRTTEDPEERRVKSLIRGELTEPQELGALIKKTAEFVCEQLLAPDGDPDGGEERQAARNELNVPDADEEDPAEQGGVEPK